MENKNENSIAEEFGQHVEDAETGLQQADNAIAEAYACYERFLEAYSEEIDRLDSRLISNWKEFLDEHPQDYLENAYVNHDDAPDLERLFALMKEIEREVQGK